MSIGNKRIGVAAGESAATLARRITRQIGGVDAQASGGTLQIATTACGNRAALAVTARDPSSTLSQLTVSGLNASQVAAIDTSGFTSGNATLTGTVDIAASVAELLYAGATGGVVAGTALFRLAGSTGSANFSISEGQSLSAVAQLINDQSAKTGIAAAAEGQDLRFYSTELGSAASLVIDNIVLEETIAVTGTNAAQIAGVTENSIPQGSIVTLDGTIDAAATAAQLAYISDGGEVVDTATFAINGPLGSSQIDIF